MAGSWKLKAAGGLAAAALLAGVAAFLSLNRIVKAAIETLGPKLAGVPVRVASVSLSPFGGSGSISGLVVGNPPGFSTPSALELGKVRVSLSPGSLLTNRIVVREVQVVDPKVSFETGSKGSNLSRIQANLESFSGPSAPPAKKGKPAGPGKSFVVRRFRVTGAQASLATHLLKGKSLTLGLPDIELKNIGESSGGASLSQVLSQAMKALTQAAAKAAAGAGGVEKAVKSGIDSAARTLKGILGGR